MKVFVSLLVALVASPSVYLGAAEQSQESVLWSAANCPDGYVHDAVCCSDDHCGKYGSKKFCQTDVTCLWSDEKDACTENRDSKNNVCCKTDTTENCKAIADGRCPLHFQVKAGCCDESGTKYTGVLVASEGYVCCNTPCASADLYEGCEKPANCTGAPGGSYFARSLGGYSDPYGFSPAVLPVPSTHGKIIDFTGFEHAAHLLPVQKPKTEKKVEELTVDDLMESLIKALTNDKGTVNNYDVFEFKEHKINDPYLGKTSHGGRIGGLNFPDPNLFLKQIYGSPYGIGLGPFGSPKYEPQHAFGGYGYGGFGFGGYDPYGYPGAFGHGYERHGGYGPDYGPYHGHGFNGAHGSYAYQPYGYDSHGNSNVNSYGGSYGHGGFAPSPYGYGPADFQPYGYPPAQPHGPWGSAGSGGGYGQAHAQGHAGGYGRHGSSSEHAQHDSAASHKGTEKAY